MIAGEILPPTPGQQDFAPRLLNGSQAKTAFALRMNAERMIKEDGLECCGFLTLTVGDQNGGRFVQVKDSAEASKRVNNLNRRVLKDLFERAIIVTERHKSGAVHFHVLGTLRGKPDIRTGFDFDQVKQRDYRAVPAALRDIWAMLRERLPEYGFGRAELTPIRKTGESVASYVSKYIEKNVYARLPEDKGKKLVRYIGWDKKHLKPNEFGWAGPKAVAWRAKTRATAALANITEPEQAAEALGPRWAFTLSNLWMAASTDNILPKMDWDWATRETVRANLFGHCSRWMESKEREWRVSAAVAKQEVELGEKIAEWGENWTEPFWKENHDLASQESE